LSSGWTQDDLKTAYKRESQRLHPDKWTGKPANIQTIMEAEFKAVQQAYNHLKK
jgi:DnaJ-class molecular chaperone